MQHQSGIKVMNGMIILTRRMYLIYFIAGFAFAVALWICLNTVLGPNTQFGRGLSSFLPLFYDLVNWVFPIAIGIHFLEAVYICRKFQQREAFLLRERGEQYIDQG